VTPASKPVAAFLGTGIMGLPMARNALAAALEVRAWNRTRERAEPLADDGASIADSPAEAVRGADLVVTMLSAGDAVLSVMDGHGGALAAMDDEALWLQMSTIGVEATERCAELAKERGVELVDAPVLGTKKPAEDAKLVVLASGPDAAQERCAPLFDAVGQRTMWLGAAGEGSRLKLVLNAWIVSVLEGLAETIALAEGAGVDPASFLAAIEGGGLDIQYAHLKGKLMMERTFDPQFSLELATKDADLVVGLAEQAGLDLPVLRAIAARMREGVEAGHGAEDMAATYLTSAPRR
jgi:3-hydroxyisobutyrate dehydrogenase